MCVRSVRRQGVAGRGSAALATAGALWLAACAVPVPPDPGALDQITRPGEPRHLRERRLERLWAGRTRRELEAVWGAPRLVMRLPAPREPEVLVLVFPDRDPHGRCIDAFVVLRDDPETIWTYICR